MWNIKALFGLIILFLASFSYANSEQRYSTLSDGTLETQLERPKYEALTPGSLEMMTALNAFDALPYDVGERIQYLITYLGIKGGSAEVVVHLPVKIENEWGLRVSGEVKSAEWYSWITRVHDVVESAFFPQHAHRPHQFYINQQESKYFNSKIVVFDHGAAQIRQQERRKGGELKTSEHPLVKDSKDGVGALYFLREQIRHIGKQKMLEFPIFTSDETWTGQVRFLKSELKEVLGHQFETDVYALDTNFGGLLQQEGDIRIWFTRDERQLPVYIQANVAFGYIEVELVEWDQGYVNPKKKKVFPSIRKKDN